MWWNGNELVQAVKVDPLLTPKRTPNWSTTVIGSPCAGGGSTCSTRASTPYRTTNGFAAHESPVWESSPSSGCRKSRSRNGSAPPGGRKAQGKQEFAKTKEQRERMKRPASASLLLRGSGAGKAAVEDSFRQNLEDREVQALKDHMRRESILARFTMEQANADGSLADLILMHKGTRQSSSKGRPGSAPAGLGGARAACRANAAAAAASGAANTPAASSMGKLRQASAGPKTATEEVKDLCQVLDRDILHHCGRLDMREEAAKWCLAGSANALQPRGRRFSLLKSGIQGRLGFGAASGRKGPGAWGEDAESEAGVTDGSVARSASRSASKIASGGRR